MSDNKKYCYDYPRPALTTDCLLFGYSATSVRLLLIQRGQEPFKGQWALPGGFVEENETTDQAVKREVMEETNLTGLNLKQFKTYSEPDRDPRHRTVSVVYIGLVERNKFNPMAGDDADHTQWFSINELPVLAFDHEKIVKEGGLFLLEGLQTGTFKTSGFNSETLQYTIEALQRSFSGQ